MLLIRCLMSNPTGNKTMGAHVLDFGMETLHRFLCDLCLDLHPKVDDTTKVDDTLCIPPMRQFAGTAFRQKACSRPYIHRLDSISAMVDIFPEVGITKMPTLARVSPTPPPDTPITIPGDPNSPTQPIFMYFRPQRRYSLHTWIPMGLQ